MKRDSNLYGSDDRTFARKIANEALTTHKPIVISDPRADEDGKQASSVPVVSDSRDSRAKSESNH